MMELKQKSFTMIIDDKDFNTLSKHKWCLISSRLPGRRANRSDPMEPKFIYAHKLIHGNKIRISGDVTDLRAMHFKDRTEYLSDIDDNGSFIQFRIEGHLSKIDSSDFWRLKDRKYYVAMLGKNARISRNGERGSEYLHCDIMGKKKGFVIDHINRDTLDNRRSNLRFATWAQNAINSEVQSNNKSGIRGVYWNKQSKRWVATIKINGVNIRIGSFKDKELAAKARMDREVEEFGEFSVFYDASR